MPEIALAKVDPEAPLDVVCTLACGATTGHRRGALHRQGRAGLDLRGLRRRARRARRGGRLPAGRRRADHRRRPVRGAARARPRQQGATDTLVGGPDTRRPDPRDDRRLRRRLHLRGHRQRRGDAPGGRVGAHGLGPLHDRRRGRQGRGARGRAALPDHRPPHRRRLVRRREGSRPRARAGRHSTCRATSTSSRWSPAAWRSTR